jgi:dolichol-phosphate mannosyltransferase
LYLIIGGTSAVCNIVLFILFIQVGLNLTTAIVTAYLSAAAINYFLCILILFRHKSAWSTPGEILAYLTTLAIMGFFDAEITLFLSATGIPLFLCKSIASLFGFVGNFLLRKYLVFPEKSIA